MSTTTDFAQLMLARGDLTLALLRMSGTRISTTLHSKTQGPLAYAASDVARIRVDDDAHDRDGDDPRRPALWLDAAAFDLRPTEIERVHAFLAAARDNGGRA